MVAKIALLIWPLISAAFFRLFSLPAAVAATIIWGYLLLPTHRGFDFPLLPAFDKDLIPALAALVIGSIALRNQAPGTNSPGTLNGWLPRSVVGRILFGTLLLGTLMTTITNGDSLVFEERTLRGLSLYDGLANLQDDVIMLLPLFLARKFMAEPNSHKTLLWVLCIAGLIYSLPALYEVRMSPQFNRMVYGFFPHSWRQHLRDGGFRPLVFLEHGLWLGIFLSCAAIAAASCVKSLNDAIHRRIAFAATFWLLMTVLLSKTFGAAALAILFIPVALFFKPRTQLLVAAGFATLVLAYPMLRGSGVVPVNHLVSAVATIAPGRASSLTTRLVNEDALLEKAVKRPLFGWGTWGRNRVFDEKGQNISTTDGGWILVIGEGGWVRYLSQMGLLALPILLLALRRNHFQVSAATAGLCLVLAANLIDLIPNDTLTPVTWLIAGALLGRLEWEHADHPETAAETSKPSEPVSRYARAGRRAAVPLAPSAPRRSVYTRQTRTLTRREQGKT